MERWWKKLSKELDGITITDSVEDCIRHLDACEILSHRVGNPGRRRKPYYLDCVTAFDIETTTLDLPDRPQAIMYIWQWAFSRDLVLIGRTWDDFRVAVDRISDYCETREQRLKLVVYDFNLSFEFQFLKGVFRFEDPADIFVMDSRKILKCNIGALEIRCAMLHSNMSLDKYTQAMGCTRRKLTGTLDYSVKRYPWTELTDTELRYCIYDVVSLVEAVEREMSRDGDNLETIPLTSTGYVRRDAKTAIRNSPGWYNKLRPLCPDLELYAALREMFRGGDTHANRFYAGCLVHGVLSADRSSSYPDVMVNHRFPMKPFVRRGPVSLARFEYNIDVHRKAAVIRIALRGVRLRNPYCGCPYLTRDKSRTIIKGRCDNGRILSADYLETTINDLDYRIIRDQYIWDPESDGTCIYDSWWSSYDYLPETFRELVREYYRRKTLLKAGPDSETPEERESREYYYGKSKNLLNSLYGMCAQNVLKPELQYTTDTDYYEAETDDAARLEKRSRQAQLPYQIGCWVTAWARWELHRAVKIADDQGLFVYCDTDSIKYVGDVDLSSYNASTKERSVDNGACAQDVSGVTHYMGVYELETPKPIDTFVTWGSKKYAYVDDTGLHVTVSGVNKLAGAAELEEKGGIKAFAPGFVFRKAGGTESIYNDNINMTVTVDGRDLHVTDNVVIKESEYTLGITGEYEQLLRHGKLLQELFDTLDFNQ